MRKRSKLIKYRNVIVNLMNSHWTFDQVVKYLKLEFRITTTPDKIRKMFHQG
jgi:hypothetical protein